MISVDRFDVAIVGAGPAGSRAAWRMAKAGARVAIFEDPSVSRIQVDEAQRAAKILRMETLVTRVLPDRPQASSLRSSSAPGSRFVLLTSAHAG